MAEIIKSIVEIEDLFREIVLAILHLDPEKNHSRVRFPWGSNLDDMSDEGSAPVFKRSDDVCMIYALPYDNQYNRTRERHVEDHGGIGLVMADTHTDVHQFTFANYGPNAYECARDIRDGLFRQDIKRMLHSNNFALVTDCPAPKRVPEFWDGKWWNRVDFTAVFNELVRRESEMLTFEQFRFTVAGGADKNVIEEDSKTIALPK